jgi:hypothetical protein
MKSLLGGLVKLVRVADLNVELFVNTFTRDSYTTAKYSPIGPGIAETSPEMWICMTICLYTESQLAILPDQVRSAILVAIRSFVEVGKETDVFPSFQEPIPNCEKAVELRIELLYGKSPTVMSHPRFLRTKGQQSMRAEALIGLVLSNIIRWPFTQISLEGKRAYLMLLDMALSKWQLKWPSRLGGTWKSWNVQDILDLANSSGGWNANEVWNAWLSVVNRSQT